MSAHRPGYGRRTLRLPPHARGHPSDAVQEAQCQHLRIQTAYMAGVDLRCQQNTDGVHIVPSQSGGAYKTSLDVCSGDSPAPAAPNRVFELSGSCLSRLLIFEEEV